MTVLLAENLQNSERFRMTLGESTVVIRNGRELRDFLTANPQEVLVVIGPEFSLDDATQVVEYYRSTRPALGFILIRSRLEVAVMSQAMQSGVREVVGTDDASALLAATKRSIAVSERMTDTTVFQEPAAKGKVVLVFSAKGGCGKTTVATNVAEALGANGEKSVCIVDFDLQFGDVAVALQIEPTKTISNAIRMGENLDLSGVRSLVLQYQPNLYALLAPVDPSDIEFITADLAEKVISGLAQTFDYVVIDSPPAFTETILKAFDLADEYLLVTTLDIPSLKNLKVSLGTLDALGMPRSKWNIIINRSTAKTGLSAQDVHDAIGLPIWATIPASQIVPTMINQGRTVVSGKPKHKVAKAMLQIAHQVEKKMAVETRGSHKAASSRSTIFARAEKGGRK
jgi:pilus assembly protein CpaE